MSLEEAQAAHHLLTRFFCGFVWGSGGNQPSLGLPAPRLSPPGRPGQQAQVSHTAGSSASRRGAREGHSPGATGGSGPALRDSGQVGWPSVGRQAQPDLMPSLPPLRGETAQVCPQKHPEVPSHDPRAHPTPRATMPASVSYCLSLSPASPWGARVMTLFQVAKEKPLIVCRGGTGPTPLKLFLQYPCLSRV